MSEVTTGAVALSLIGAPIAVGAVCVVAAGYAIKYCHDKYADMLKDIQATDERLLWLNSQQVSSPIQLAEEAKKLHEIVFRNELFVQMTSGLSIPEKNVLATAIVTENSPIKAHIPGYLKEMEHGLLSFDKAINACVSNLAEENLGKVKNVIVDAANASGFNSNVHVISQSKRTLDIVFTDSQDRKFTALIKLNKELNPSLALDLEGFVCNTEDCTNKMDEIVKYLNNHGIPFEYKKLKHNQPSGVLRKLIQKKSGNSKDAANYLASSNSNYLTGNKQK